MNLKVTVVSFSFVRFIKGKEIDNPSNWHIEHARNQHDVSVKLVEDQYGKSVESVDWMEKGAVDYA